MQLFLVPLVSWYLELEMTFVQVQALQRRPQAQRISLVLWMLTDLSVLCFHHMDFFVIVCFLF